MIIVLTVTVVGASVGTALGIIAGWYGKHIDEFIMRLVDFTLAVPFILVALVVVIVFGERPRNTTCSCFGHRRISFSFSTGYLWQEQWIVINSWLPSNRTLSLRRGIGPSAYLAGARVRCWLGGAAEQRQPNKLKRLSAVVRA